MSNGASQPNSPLPRPPRDKPPRYDAIHRALLAGLLTNVGYRAEGYEYAGPRGIKFHLFPGSALFNAKPKWVMAGEIVQTTRLYARTVAEVDTAWIERLGAHLVTRTYHDPHWDRNTAHVRAYERVTLHGLVLVPRRRVHYGPIAPREARDIFIHAALVQGEYRSNAPFLAHNLGLVEQVKSLEAKLRQRDLLASDAARFAFFDASIPPGIYSGPLFERWRREAERREPKLLFMNMSRVLSREVAYRPEDYPDEIEAAGLTLPLEYRFDPGGPADGVTVTVPLAVLAQLPPTRFDWLVPGWLKEKVVALIRALPKAMRVNFVGAARFAEAAVERMTFDEAPGGSLYAALSRELGALTGAEVPLDAWQPAALPDHLRMNFRVLDEDNRIVAVGRDLGEIQEKLRSRAIEILSRLESPFNRARVTRWDFGDLPGAEGLPVKHRGLTLAAHPAVIDAGDSVTLQLVESFGKAEQASRAGVRRLFMLQLADEIRQVFVSLPGVQTMCLHYAPLGSCDRLKADLAEAITHRVFLDAQPAVRTHMEFELRLRGLWTKLPDAGKQVAAEAAPILAAYHAAALRLASPAKGSGGGGSADADVPLLWQPAVDDMREQLALLMAPGFLARTPRGWLRQYSRYLKAIELRLHKLANAGLARDNRNASLVTPWWLAYLQRWRDQQAAGIDDPQLDQFRWMLEEYRVSLFAQELGTAIPISTARLEKQWSLTRMA